ncbi:rhamnogalacturonan lyase [Streptomyces litchfieldiae]|uniref:Rhamnogalacturonan lyase n=1 Tax=Streptomyces litchfieldiae TaxID=3075543 RepID=A0ABU2MIC7_9ACTN|nr:rhamnogalacturonan lyase [Streptomyces sp. DSM 44938]MDT0341342.1 rhamnogalacturonan lyase [Streptomyces sp. DSM 44938]
MRSKHHKRDNRRVRTLLAAALAGVVTAGGLTALAHASDERETPATPAPAASATPYQMDDLGRGLVSVGGDKGNLVSWRLLATDADDVAFHVYRDGTRVTEEPLTGVTNYLDEGAPADARYTVSTVTDGAEVRDAAEALNLPNAQTDIPIDSPGGDYVANDASVGDLNGDGELEIVLKWDPSNAKDNSQAGVTGNVYLDAYTLGGDRLWRIDLGRNIRAGAHYTQFQVFDYDGDGSAEVAAKTADGTVDGAGTVIGDANADHRNSDGYILEGPEFLTMFDGATGAAVDTVDYVPGRGNICDWGDCYGNRGDRFLAGTAYLDGQRPSLIMARGYYTRSVVAAWDFDGSSLTRRWVFDSDEAGSQYREQGSHSLSVGDLDGDGRDEIAYGAMAIDDDGGPLWNANTRHGDAQHLGDFDPANEGLEYFKVSEWESMPGSVYLDAASGEILWQTASGSDNGRGVAGDIWDGSPGAEFWSAADGSLRNTAGEEIGRKPSSINFLSWWDGDLTRELLDDTHIDKYGPDGDTRLLTGSGVASNNGTKATPALSADILGDWREEVIWRTSDNSALRIYATDIPTEHAIPALMQDRQYRTGVAWQNTAYNQPPHPSFSIGPDMAEVAPSDLAGVPAGRADTAADTRPLTVE